MQPLRLLPDLSNTDRIGNAVTDFARDQGLRLILTALGTVIAVRLVRIVLYRLRRRMESSRLASRGVAEIGRLRAVFDVLDYLAAAMVVAVGFMTGLSILGVNTGALLASAGVLGFAVGFGAQTMVKDLLNGLFLLAEGQYTVGDLIEVSGVTGTVERVTLRTTTLRAFNGDVHIVPSGDVRVVTNRSKEWARVIIDAGVGYDTPVERAMAVLEAYCLEVAADPQLAGLLLETPTVLGVEAFQEHQYVIRVVTRVLPDRRLVVERRMRLLLRLAFERAGIEAPVVAPSVTPTPVVARTGEGGPTPPPVPEA